MFNQMTDDEFCFREKILKTAKQCLAENYSERPELCVLREKYESRRRRYGLDKAAMDALIYERMHAKPPEKSSDTMKIRYWRTGHHYPVNRHLCMAFARALELSAMESHWLLTSWMDKSADYYEKAPSADDILYWERRKRFNNMVMAYFRFRTSAQKCFSYGAFRHCYYLDALQYVDSEKAAEIWKNNIYSINYDSELKRTAMLLGEIPRKTMLRHLILLSLPDLTLKKLQEDLDFFGYLPLSPEHTLTGGERLDRLVIKMIEFYEILAKKYGANMACRWFRRCWRDLDDYFISEKEPGFRLFYFKSLGQKIV